MIKFTATMSTYEFNAAGYTRAMKSYLEKQTRLAAAEFAKAALARIPVQTGFVSGAFGTLTDLLGSGARFSPIVSAVRKILRKAKSFISPEVSSGLYYQGVLKGKTSGRQFATPTSEIIQWQGDVLIFNYNVDISYFALQDVQAGPSPSAPWGAFEAGQAAFEQYMEKSGLLAIPKIEDYLTPKIIKLG